MRLGIGWVICASALVSCVGTTGGAIVDFKAAAAGPSDAVAGQALVFGTDRGWTVTLTRATLHVGAAYLDQSATISGAGDTSCILPGTYVAQITSGMDVDLLSPAAQAFPALGHGVTGRALVAQVWLTGGDVNAIDDRTHILEIAGSAQSGSDVRPFTGVITIGSNRETSGSLAGANPPCKQRLAVIPLRTPLDVESTGGLLVRIDPRQLFADVDFGQLSRPNGGSVYAFQDNANDPASSNLYTNIHAGGSLYTFHWVENP